MMTTVNQEINTLSQDKSQLVQQYDQLAQEARGLDQRLTAEEQELVSNVGHLNELTKTVAQLRDVVNTIGTKMGTRVDRHEEALSKISGELDQIKRTNTKGKR